MNVARISFIIGSTGFVFIGLLHTYVHFQALAGDDLFKRFTAVGTVRIGSMDAAVWGLFQGTSILMGFFSLALGLVLLAYCFGRERGQGMHTSICAITIAMLGAIIIVGSVHLSMLQVYGGIFGIFCFGLPIAVNTLKKR
ncbi:MAG: hypothetical protein AAGG69_06810 [Pseudomonadota bacterium]